MAYSVDEIHLAREEETKREKLPLSDETRAGLEHHYRDDAANPGRRKFKVQSRREIPDFTANDFELRIVIAQAAYSHFRRSLPWKRVPELLIVDPPELTRLIAARLDEQATARPNQLSSFNTTKDYVACLSAVAYLKWRLGWHGAEIANYIKIPINFVYELSGRLRYNASRLGMPMKFQLWRPPTRTAKEIRSEVARRMWADPEYRKTQSVAMKSRAARRWAAPGAKEEMRRKLRLKWTPERKAKQSARTKEQNAKNREKLGEAMKLAWTPERREKHSAFMQERNAKQFLRSVAWG